MVGKAQHVQRVAQAAGTRLLLERVVTVDASQQEPAKAVTLELGFHAVATASRDDPQRKACAGETSERIRGARQEGGLVATPVERPPAVADRLDRLLRQ